MFALVCDSKGKAVSSNNTTKLCYFYFEVEREENYFKISFRYLFLPLKHLEAGQKTVTRTRY